MVNIMKNSRIYAINYTLFYRKDKIFIFKAIYNKLFIF